LESTKWRLGTADATGGAALQQKKLGLAYRGVFVLHESDPSFLPLA
jgi:hypothetical protein